MKYKCNSIQHLLSDYIDGTLSKGQMEEIGKHIASCSKCRKALNSLKETNKLLELYIEDEPSDNYFDSVWLQIENEITERSKESYWQRSKKNLSLKFCLLKRYIYDGFIFWTEHLNWRKLLWQSMVVILLMFSAVLIDRTYFSSSIDKALLRNITQSQSKDGFYLIKYTQKPGKDFTIIPSRKTYYKRHAKEDIAMNKQRLPRTLKHPSPYSEHNSAPSVIEFGNGFLTFIGNIETLGADEYEDYSQKELLNLVNISNPKNIKRVNISNKKELQLQLNNTNIEEIKQSFLRKKDIKENPFRAFLTDVPTSGLTSKDLNSVTSKSNNGSIRFQQLFSLFKIFN